MNKSFSRRETLVKVLRSLKRHWVLIALSAVFALVSAGLMMYIPILIGRSVDLMLGAGRVDFNGLFKNLLLIGVLAVAAALSQWLMNVCNNAVSFKTTRDLRSRAFGHIQSLPLSYLDSHPSGDILSRIIADVDQFSDGLLLGFSQL
ncbi:MAG: ABC transporter ATP-binding protein, partial [Clostridia bacterium]|nr:ABC transporter ATP-binding protein [Clostridia bacterium]